jgi:DNA (cytosine-5)-methyltransferase 1
MEKTDAILNELLCSADEYVIVENHEQDQFTLLPDSSTDWRTRVFSQPTNTVRLATTFSGIGAIEHALKRLGLHHEIVFAGDSDKHVQASYLANYEIDKNHWHNDIKEFSAKQYKGSVDLLVGGSPCQAFSMVGKRLGLEDIRGTLFYEFARIVSETQPKVFIYENVKGLINHDKGNTWQVVRDVFNDLGYKIFTKVLNSKDYGIPQHRERIVVIGFLEHDVEFDFPAPIPLEYTMQDFLEDYTDSKYYLKSKGIKFVTSSKNRAKRYTQINGDIALCQKANQQFNWHGDFVFESMSENSTTNAHFDEFIFDVNEVEEKYYLSDKVRKYVLSEGTKDFKTTIKTDLEIARPLLQSMHKMHRAGVDNYVTHKGRIRKLTPRECLRLMGFTDDFEIAVSDTQMYRQAGNSIVVDMLIALLKQMDITRFTRP